MKFVITIAQDEDGVYIAECPAIPGCVSQGATEQEAEKNIPGARFPQKSRCFGCNGTPRCVHISRA